MEEVVGLIQEIIYFNLKVSHPLIIYVIQAVVAFSLNMVGQKFQNEILTLKVRGLVEPEYLLKED